MPSGQSGIHAIDQPWVKEHEKTQALVMEIQRSLQVGSTNTLSGDAAFQASASIRRMLETLGSQIERLSANLDAADDGELPEKEKASRRDQVNELQSTRDSVLRALERSSQQEDRANSVEDRNSQLREAMAPEHKQTANLDRTHVLMLQKNFAKAQNGKLEAEENKTEHASLAINSEGGLQTRLLGDFNEEVDTADTHLRASLEGVSQFFKHVCTCRCWLLVFLLIAVFVYLTILWIESWNF